MNTKEKFLAMIQRGYAYTGINVEKVNGKWVRKAHIECYGATIPGTSVFFVTGADGREHWDPVESIEEARALAQRLA